MVTPRSARSPSTPGADVDVVLGVSGGIAAYKSVELLRLFTESRADSPADPGPENRPGQGGGYRVRVVPTRAALNFVGAATWAALSGHPVTTEVWDDVAEVPHVRIGQEADLVVVAPATADLLARAAAGLADDLLTNVLLTARCPVLYVPAMHTEMWLHPATQENVATLRRRGALVLEPAIGRLTGADSGVGRFPEPEQIFEACRRILARGDRQDLMGRHVVVSAGGTREHLDPVRFLGNRSSGRQGYALASTALARGAEVTLVAANVDLGDPAGAKVVRVGTAEELRAAVLAAAIGADAVVMAAAVADYRPAVLHDHKLKTRWLGAEPEPVALVRNPDVLLELVERRRRTGQESSQQVRPVLVGFAAETGDAEGDVLSHGRAKLASKACDLLVVNEVGAELGFERPDNAATVLGADGTERVVPRGPKEALADAVWDLVVARLDAIDG